MTRGSGVSHGVHAACPCRSQSSFCSFRSFPWTVKLPREQGAGHGSAWPGATEAAHAASMNGAVPSILSLLRCSYKVETADASGLGYLEVLGPS